MYNYNAQFTSWTQWNVLLLSAENNKYLTKENIKKQGP